MGRYPRLRSESDVQRRIKAGFGQGNGDDFRPWFYVQHVPSKGRSHKISGIKHRRVHHLLSDLEAACFYLLDFSTFVIQIREQCALLPRETGLRIADQLEIRHPVYPKTKVPIVITTDFYVDILLSKNSRLRQIAISVKPSSQLQKRRTCQKLMLEREANRALGYDWYLFTEDVVSRRVIKNLRWLRYGARRGFESYQFNSQQLMEFSSLFRIYHCPTESLCQTLNKVASKLNVEWYFTLTLFKASVWHHYLNVDVHAHLSVDLPTIVLEEPDHVLSIKSFEEQHIANQGSRTVNDAKGGTEPVNKVAMVG